MTTLWLEFLLAGDGRGLAAPGFNQPFYWLVDMNTTRGDLYTYGGGFGAQLTSFQWRHPKAQEERHLAGMRFRPFWSQRYRGRVHVSWALQIGRQLQPEDFPLLEKRLRDCMAYLSPWGRLPGERL
jgi:hypothetical protein